MKLAVASGKGGTGKTLIATNLAEIAADNYSTVLYDLDVEEPNDHLFFPGTTLEIEEVKRMIPVVDEMACTYCGICSEICEYNAIISLADNVLVFPELCHSCYGCLELCPEGAINEGIKNIGEISVLKTDKFPLVSGKLKISESATPALIRKTKWKTASKIAEDLQIYDAPPGSSCPLIEAVKDVDFVLLVGEPSPFGLHDMDLVAQTLDRLDKPYGVVINKAVENNKRIEQYCHVKGIEILGRISQDIKIARSYARGELVCNTIPEMKTIFKKLLDRIISLSEVCCR